MAAPKKDAAPSATSPEELPSTAEPGGAELAAEVERLRAELDAARERERQLRAELDGQAEDLRAQLEALRTEHREELDAQRQHFKDAWTRRELEIAALGPSSPVRGKVLYARHNLRCHTREGAPLRVPAGAPLPDSVDPLSVPVDAIEER